MFIQRALSAFPDLTPSHNGNAAAEEVRSQTLRSISVQPSAGSATSDEGKLVFILFMGTQKQIVQQVVKDDRNQTTAILHYFFGKKTNMDILTTGTS